LYSGSKICTCATWNVQGPAKPTSSFMWTLAGHSKKEHLNVAEKFEVLRAGIMVMK